MTGEELKEALEANCISQRSAANHLGINERTMRRYCSSEDPIQKCVEYALRWLNSTAFGALESTDTWGMGMDAIRAPPRLAPRISCSCFNGVRDTLCPEHGGSEPPAPSTAD